MLAAIMPARGTRWTTVFHVTHQLAVPSIRKLGILPQRSRRPAKRVWLCDLSQLPWALRHVTETQGWAMSEVAVLRVCLPREVLLHHRTGVHYLKITVPPQFIGARLSCQY